MIRPEVEERLIAGATDARTRALCQYSGFAVGAAIEDSEGKVWTGCNIENSTFGLTVCAERVATWKALSEGIREFRAVAVVTGASEPTPPCGACRQILWEFCGNAELILANLSGKQESLFLKDIFPRPFDASFL